LAVWLLNAVRPRSSITSPTELDVIDAGASSGAAVPAIWSSTETRRPEARMFRPLATAG
jgi:hypothetical protein